MKLGVIGTGNMGSTFIEGIYSVRHHGITVFAYNRTKEKIRVLSRKYSELNVCHDIQEVIEGSMVLVFAVPFSFIQRLPHSVITVLQKKEPLTIVLSSYVPIKLLQKYLTKKVIKAYPNINWSIGSGVTILHFGTHINENEKKTIINLLARIGAVYEVPEDQFRPFGNLMSCGPALWIKLIDLFVEANVRRYSVDSALGFEVAQKTIEGTFRLMRERGFDRERIIKTVVSPGGTTEVGLDCFEQSLPRIFDDTVEQIGLREEKRIQGLEAKEVGNSLISSELAGE